MRFTELAFRNLKEVYRDRVAMGFLMVMPLTFILILGWAFGGQEVPPASLGVIPQDKSPQATAFVEMLRSVEANLPEEIPAFHLTLYESEDRAMEALKVGKLTGFLVIPQGFGGAMMQGASVPLSIVYDANDPMAAPRVVPIIREVALSFLEVEIPLVLEARGTTVEVESEFMNFLVPGMTIFGLMILVPTMVGMMGRDKERGFLSRLFTFPFRPFDFILGYSLPFVPIMAVQVLIYIGVGMLMGLKIIGNFGLAFLLFFLIGLCCVGIAMIVGSFVKTQQQGEPVSWIFLIPLSMLSGVWFSVDMMPSVLVNIVNFFPFVHAVHASRQVITMGVGFSDILLDLYWLIGWTIALFTAGVVLFRRSMSS